MKFFNIGSLKFITLTQPDGSIDLSWINLIIGGIFAPSSPNSPNWGEIANTEEWTGDSVIAAVASTLTTS